MWRWSIPVSTISRHLEGSQYRTNENLHQTETTDMEWPRVREGMGGYDQEEAKRAGAGKKVVGEVQER